MMKFCRMSMVLLLTQITLRFKITSQSNAAIFSESFSLKQAAPAVFLLHFSRLWQRQDAFPRTFSPRKAFQNELHTLGAVVENVDVFSAASQAVLDSVVRGGDRHVQTHLMCFEQGTRRVVSW